MNDTASPGAERYFEQYFEQYFENPIAEAVWWACVTELRAFKPGNVSVYAPGHGMSVDDFITSARCVAPILGALEGGVGERIYRSIEATHTAVGCNTNLGIVLLCAPLAQAASEPSNNSLRQRLQQVLERLDRDDAEQVFRAIRLANPAGLGRSDNHDVGSPPQAGLIDIMRVAADRDRIAYQYAYGFSDIFELGLPVLKRMLARWSDAVWATLGVYLKFLARFPDTHIQRKLGKSNAEQVRRDAKRLLVQFETSERPEYAMPLLRAFDERLKQRGINPGTSADLTVATLLAARLQALAEHDSFLLDSLIGSKSLQKAGASPLQRPRDNPTQPS